MGLGKYFKKRDFAATPEPKGKVEKRRGPALRFVVQKHHASQLHYDVRLELGGVLKSWAVPKGPSLNPHDRHLAVAVEDHPLDYRNFEGHIPEGHYGAGDVIVWDEGTYEPRWENPDQEAEVRKGLKKGHLTVIFYGQKLKGEFAFIKLHGKDEDAWLMIKKEDEFASEKDITKEDRSVKSGRRVDEAESKAELSEYPKHPLPTNFKPMLATLVDTPFDKEGWLFEVKWDGYRAIGVKNGREIQLYSRNGLDFAERYAPITDALKQLPENALLDGEIVVVDDAGRPRFEWLQDWRKTPQGTLRYYVFDLPWYQGRDITSMPLTQRKEILASLVPTNSPIVLSDHLETKGALLFEDMKKQGLEGIVAKRAASRYAAGVRTAEWLKIKTHLRQEVVIGGFTEPRGGRKYVGSLILDTFEHGVFTYVGHSGGGIPNGQLKSLRQQLDKLERKTSPFSETVKPNAPVHWVEPKLVCEASFSEWTNDGRMRHPEFEGLRPDKEAKNVHKEKPKTTGSAANKNTPAKSRVEFSHLDKVFFPEAGYTKGDLITYYESVAGYILPYIKDRPHSLNRHPSGIAGESFYQKNMEHPPSWAKTEAIFSERNNEDVHYFVATNLDSLLYMVQLGCIEINPWNSRIKHLEKPDWAVIDLDPEGSITFEDVITVARTVHDVCQEWGVPSYPKTSGKTGIHIFIPMAAKYDYEQVKQFANLIVLEVNKRQPELTSVERMPAARPNKIYLDFLQNRKGQTLAAPYSVRPTPKANVSTPLHWDEVKPGLTPERFTIRTIHARLKKEGDLWKPILGKGVDLAKLLKRLGS